MDEESPFRFTSHEPLWQFGGSDPNELPARLGRRTARRRSYEAVSAERGEREQLRDPGVDDLCSFGAWYVNLARDRPSLSGSGAGYSHSIVDGGFEEMSRATRLTAGISLMIRLEIVSSRW
jgi:hypothetical protein